MKKMTISLALALLLLWFPQRVSAERLLVPGGEVIGLQLGDNTVTVAAFDEETGSAARAAGLKVGDRITHINGKTICTTSDIREALNQADGVIRMQICRSGKERQLQLTPSITTEGPRLGVYLKQGVTGIGTVTWYDPDTGTFAALGHGVNDQSGNLLRLQQGTAYEASVVSVKKGRSGTPGQLLGVLNGEEAIGQLQKNTNQGVFGTAKTGWAGEKLPVGGAGEIQTGSASILSTVSDGQVQEYSVEILKIYPNQRSAGRNMLLRVTDQRLLDTTGGIVQGMSGSPIIQDGKLVGAVTHVLVNDPTTGYGIFIENMLDAAA